MSEELKEGFEYCACGFPQAKDNPHRHSLQGELLDELAALEHEQWMEWTETLAGEEALSPNRLQRWKSSFKPYEELTEAQQESDRNYAKKVLLLLKKKGLV